MVVASAMCSVVTDRSGSEVTIACLVYDRKNDLKG